MKKFIMGLFIIFIIHAPMQYSQWIQQISGTSNRFMTCFFLDQNTGWAAGNLVRL